MNRLAKRAKQLEPVLNRLKHEHLPVLRRLAADRLPALTPRRAPLSVPSAALGAAALGALAFGALAIGALAVGRVMVGKARFRRLYVDQLTVRSLYVGNGSAPAQPAPEGTPSRDSVIGA